MGERLFIIASEERLNEPLMYAKGAALRLVETLRARYNFVIMDVPYLPMPSNRDLIEYSHHSAMLSAVMNGGIGAKRDPDFLNTVESMSIMLPFYRRPTDFKAAIQMKEFFSLVSQIFDNYPVVTKNVKPELSPRGLGK